MKLCTLSLAALLGLASATGASGQPERFTPSEIAAGRTVHRAPEAAPATPTALLRGADLRRLVVVVESAARHITLLDGAQLVPLHRFASRELLPAGALASPDGRHLVLVSQDGWVSKYDLWQLALTTEIRVAAQSVGFAMASDGSVLAVANAQPHSLVLLDTELNLLKLHLARDRDGKLSSPLSAVLNHSVRRSFVATLRDVPEVWEISYNPHAEDIATGWVHDFQYKEGAFVPGYLNPRRSILAEPLDAFTLGPGSHEVTGIGRSSGKGQVIHLDVRKKIADLPAARVAPGNHDAAPPWQDKAFAQFLLIDNGRHALATLPRRVTDGGALVLFDVASRQEIRRIPMDAPTDITTPFSPTR